MDQAAQATCLEIAFGLNTLFSAFEDFRRSIDGELSHCSATCLAYIKTIEGVPRTGQQKLIVNITAIGARHLNFQEVLTPWTRYIALLFAAFCIAVLYLGWMEWMGRCTLILMIPVPLYATVCSGNVALMRHSMENEINDFNQAKNKLQGRSEKLELFKIPPLPPIARYESTTGVGLQPPLIHDTPHASLKDLPIEDDSKAHRAWKAAVQKFSDERPLETDTIRSVTFLTAKKGCIDVLLPKALEKKIYFLRSPRNLELLEGTVSEHMGERTQVVFLIAEN